jgi:hypothetical protein
MKAGLQLGEQNNTQVGRN